MQEVKLLDLQYLIDYLQQRGDLESWPNQAIKDGQVLCVG